MAKTIFISFSFFLLFSSLIYVEAQNQTGSQLHSFIEIWHAPVTADNRTMKFFAAYSQNSTGLLKLITDGSCKISFTDSPSVQNPMVFADDTGYEYSRAFKEPVKILYSISCSHVEYPQQQQSNQADIVFEFLNVVLLEPSATVRTKHVNFICEAGGTKPDILNLYTDTSGEWKLRASVNVRGSKSPYRVNFKEGDVADGDYSWNCEAQTAEIGLFAARNQSFRVRFSPNTTCNESADCAQWKPETCISDELQMRACNNTASCKYQEGRRCAQVVEPSPQADGGVTLLDEQGTQEKPKTADVGGPGILAIFLIILVIGGGAGAIVFIRKRKSGKKEEENDEFGEEDFEEDGNFEDEEKEEENDEK